LLSWKDILDIESRLLGNVRMEDVSRLLDNAKEGYVLIEAASRKVTSGKVTGDNVKVTGSSDKVTGVLAAPK
jgi:hypothetical protein